ncbi:laccase-14 [Eucalyptus grandis]|uniref:laccase-14 n=1 Tax=Eucalyptus grandis TaxID=71139 RepID=UPI00192EB457|nr:laccase-14 [Eucalyptus grandis]
MGTFLGYAFTLTLLFCIAQGKVLRYDFVVKETPIDMLCETNRTVLTVNGLFPGPKIRAHKGDTIYVNVTNIGPYGVTIHWHGVRQIRYPWSDGPENVTQCPIPTNSSFLQKVILTEEEGTLWWHAHSDWTRATVHGPIIILPVGGTNYPYKFDKQHTIVIAEWYARDTKAIIDEALATGGDPDLSVAYTINGQPGDTYPCSNGLMYNITVVQGKTYLFRIIHSGMNEEMFFGIAKHNLTVVGMDGAYLKPLKTNYLMITPGQTMDVLVTANQSPGRYYMEFSPFVDTDASTNENVTRGIFQYSGLYAFGELEQHKFLTPSISILQAYYKEAAFVSTEVLMIKYNEEVEIRFQGTNFGAAENHPMHLHGYSFYVVGMGDGNFSDSYVSQYNTVDPPYINTVGLPKNGWTAIRFRANNPGVWFVHCHLDRHASWGMDTVLIVGEGPNTDQKLLPPPQHMPPCSGL